REQEFTPWIHAGWFAGCLRSVSHPVSSLFQALASPPLARWSERVRGLAPTMRSGPARVGKYPLARSGLSPARQEPPPETARTIGCRTSTDSRGDVMRPRAGKLPWDPAERCGVCLAFAQTPLCCPGHLRRVLQPGGTTRTSLLRMPGQGE